MHKYGLSDSNAELLLLASAIVVGYIVFHTALWYRKWKVEYFNICHEMWLKEKKGMGEDVAPWMKEKTKLGSYDVIPRSMPIAITAAQIMQIMYLLGYSENFLLIIIVMAVHSSVFFWIYIYIKGNPLVA